MFEEPTIKHIVSEVRYKPTIKYHNKRIEICEEFEDKLPHWRLDIANLIMYDQKKEEESDNIFNFVNRGASLRSKNVVHYDNFNALASYLFTKVASILEIEQIIRFGVRFYYLSEYQSTFKELKNLLFNKLYKNDFILALDIEKKLKDLAYIINFDKNFSYNNTKFHLEIGPLSAEEIKEKFGENQNNNIKVALLIDIDCFLENISREKLKKFIKDSYLYSHDILSKTYNFIKGENK